MVKASVRPDYSTEGGDVHENPRPTDEEQELAQTERLREEEAMRGGHPAAEDADAEEDSDAEKR